jgi:glycogen operon protein
VAAQRGVILDEDGTLHARVPATPTAEAVELCLLDEGGESRTGLVPDADGWWCGSVGGVAPGRRYGLRVHGPWDPAGGVRTNPAKLLLDPWARRVAGAVTDLDAARAWTGDAFTGYTRKKIGQLSFIIFD